MQIVYVTGDLIEGDQIMIAHGCNARGVFNSGMAGAIRARLPFAYVAYQSAFAKIDHTVKVGDVIMAMDLPQQYQVGNPQRPRIVANMITQDDYGRDPERVYVDYQAVARAMRYLNDWVMKTQNGTMDIDIIGPITEVGFPLIGCGLGNGSWARVSAIIEAECQCFVPIVYLQDGVMPKG